MTANQPKEIGPDATITLLPMAGKRSGLTYDATPILEFILTVGGTIGLNVVRNYLYDKLTMNGKDKLRVTINRREVNLNSRGQITRIIEEEINSRSNAGISGRRRASRRLAQSRLMGTNRVSMSDVQLESIVASPAILVAALSKPSQPWTSSAGFDRKSFQRTAWRKAETRTECV